MKKKATKQYIPELRAKKPTTTISTPGVTFHTDEEALSNARCKNCLFVVHRKYLKEKVSIGPLNTLCVHHKDGKVTDESFRPITEGCMTCSVFAYFAGKSGNMQIITPDLLNKPKQETFIQNKWHLEYSIFFYNHAPKGDIYALARKKFETRLKVKSVSSIEYEDYIGGERTVNRPYKPIFDFWKEAYLAYFMTIPAWGAKEDEVPVTPINIKSTKTRKERLDSLLQYPELLKDGVSFIDGKGRKRGNVMKELKEYLGEENQNLIGFKMYEQVIKFLPMLVEATSKLHDKDKYQLASDFLIGYLGVDLTREQIKEALREK